MTVRCHLAIQEGNYAPLKARKQTFSAALSQARRESRGADYPVHVKVVCSSGSQALKKVTNWTCRQGRCKRVGPFRGRFAPKRYARRLRDYGTIR